MMNCAYDSMNAELIGMLDETCRNKELADGIPMYQGSIVVTRYILPPVGFWMADNDTDEIEKEVLLKLIDKRLTEPEPDWYWEIFDRPVRRDILLTLKSMGAENVLDLMVETMKLLVDGGDKYTFATPKYRDFFAAIDMYGRLLYVTAIIDDAEDVEDTFGKQTIIDCAVEELNFFEKKMWPDRILRLCAGKFGIPYTLPSYGVESWNQFHPLGEHVKSVLDIFRREPDNLAMKEIQERRDLCGEGAVFYSEKNLVQMLRLGREAEGFVDFAGIDFHGIDLTDVDLCEVVFCHKRRGETWAANLMNTGVEQIGR